MPKRCAFGCEPTGAPVHRFPNYKKNPERFKEWVALCGGQLNALSDYEDFQKKIVCDRHFTENDHNRYKRLNALALPSLYLTDTSGTPALRLLETTCEPQPASGLQLCTSGSQAPVTAEMSHHGSTQTSTEAQLSITSNPLILKEHNYTAASKSKCLHTQKGQTRKPDFNTFQVNKLRSQIKKLRSDMYRLKQKGNFINRLGNAHKLQESIAFQSVVARMAKPSQLFVGMQLKGGKSPKGRRFTIEEKVLSLSLFKKSPKCYALLHKYFTLPSAKAMKRLLAKIKIGPGLNSVIFDKIKKSITEKSNEDKLCSLAFDEMSLTAQVNYDDKKDIIQGFSSNKDNDFADHVLVFMVKGIKQNFKQPIAYFFTNRLNKIELKELIKTVICHIHSAGLIVINTVCDQSTVNVSAINELVQEQKSIHLRRGKVWQHDYFSINGRCVIPLFDNPHLIKGIRNNLLTKDMIYTTKKSTKKSEMGILPKSV